MVDVCKRRMKVPARFVPYMEMHRMYELFHSLATELVIKQPDDHIMFIKQALLHLPKGRNQPKVVLIAPPHVEKVQLASIIAKTIGLVCVTHSDILMAGKFAGQEDLTPSPEAFASKARKFLRSEPHLTRGWILADFPTTRQDALMLQMAGVLPTHTFQLIPSALKDTKHLMDCKKKRSMSIEELDSGVNNYRRQLLGLRDAYRASLIEVEVRDRTMEELGSDIASLAKMMPHRGAPMLPRILLIGQRGCGRQTQANLLCKRFNLVHVDFDTLMAKIRVQDGELAEKIRMFESQYIEVYPDVLIRVLEKFILDEDCLKFGWVLTGYPRSMEEFKLLDSTDTPPNRVVFLNVPHSVCVERLSDRRFNMYTGSEHHLITRPPQGKSKKQIKIHPMDHPRTLETTLPLYESKLQEMREYAGLTATHVDGTLPIHTVFEIVSAVVVRPAPAVPPRGQEVEDEEPDAYRIETAVQTSNMLSQNIQSSIQSIEHEPSIH